MFTEIVETLLVIFLICCPLPLIGITLYWAVKTGIVPTWLKWWNPMTRRLLAYDIDERYTKPEKIQIDGVVLAIFGTFLTFLFSLFYIIQVVFNMIGMKIGAILFLTLLAASKKVVELFSVIILKKRILKT